MKKIIKKEYLLIAFIGLMVLSTVLIKPLGDLDEVWNYNIAKNVAEGKIVYKEISFITTPLQPFICAIFLKFLSNELIVMRILVAVLGSAILYLVFKMAKCLTKETNISMILTIAIGYLFRNNYSIDYNFMVLLFSLGITYLELKTQQKDKSLWIGILAGLAICTKQSVGAILAIAVTVCPLLQLQTKQDLKPVMKKIGKRILGIAIPSLLLVIYLLMTNAFPDFVSYTIQGISTFDNYKPYRNLLKSKEGVIAVLARTVPIAVIGSIIATIITKIKWMRKPDMAENTKEVYANIHKLTLYSLPMLTVIYPIADNIHFLIGVTNALLLISYLLFLIGEKGYQKIPFRKKKFWYKTVTLILWIVMVAIISNQGVKNLYTYQQKAKMGKLNDTINHFKYIEIPEYLNERIENIGNYIKQKQEQGMKVYILDAESAMMRIPLEQYTKDYDMFNKGNFGKAGEQGQIEKINQEADEETIYLVRKEEYGQNWQAPWDVINYVKENFRIVGETEIYDAYMR